MSLSSNRKRVQCKAGRALPPLLVRDVASCELDAVDATEASEGMEAEVEIDVKDMGRELDRGRT